MTAAFTINGLEARVIPEWPNHAATEDGMIWTRSSRNGQRLVPWRMMKPGFRGEYLMVHLYDHGRHRAERVHVLILEAFSGPRPARFEGRHLNDIKSDNRAANLAWGTKRENTDDAIRNQHHVPPPHPTGERHPRAKLTESDVREMRRLHKSGSSLRSLASTFGVSRKAATLAIRGQTWATV